MQIVSSRYLGHHGQDALMMCGWLIESIHYGDLGIYRDDQSKPTPSIKEKRTGCDRVNDQAK